MAICSGSVSPSTSTRTGAFMLMNWSILPEHKTRLERASPESTARYQSPTYLICNARVPSTRALSYLVMYGVVLRFSVEIFLSLTPFTVLSDFAAFSCTEMSPLVTMLPMSSPSMSPLAPPSLPGSSKSCSIRSASSIRLSSFSLFQR